MKQLYVDHFPGMHPKNRYPDQEHTVLDNGQLHVASVNLEPTMTQQHTKDEADINTIMKRYETTGQFICNIKQGGQFADFSQITDYRDMLETVKYAQDAFLTLPASVRAKFQNDPGSLLTFLQDENNYEEALSLGLVNKRETPTQTKTSNLKNDDINDDKNYDEITITKKRASKP